MRNVTSSLDKKINLRTNPLESDLKVSDLVKVRSIQEILATLDSDRKLEGISFTREMEEFCGKTFRICKRATKMILESTGELRTLKTPIVMLEGAVCDGKGYGGCDRSCFYLWQDAWLVPCDSSEQTEDAGDDLIMGIPGN